MKTTSLCAFVTAYCLAALCPSWADNPGDRFIEFRGDNDSITYDLSTVKMIQPGRFTVISTTMDNPDVMKFELKVLDTLRTYCTRPDGSYPAPDDLLTLGPPDMPVKSIEIESNKKYQTKTVIWFYPYKRLALHTQAGLEERFTLPLHCKSPRVSASGATKQNLQLRSLITNGSRSQYVVDCRRGIMSIPLSGEADDPATAQMYSVQGTGFERHYVSLCYKVTHEPPFLR